MKSGWLSASLCLAAVSLASAAALEALECPPIDPPPARTARYCPAVDSVGTSGLRIFLDRRTGRLRPPTPEEARALFESGARGLQNLEPVEIVLHPDGKRTVDLKGGFTFRVVAKKSPDGSVSARCRPAGSSAEEK